MQFEDTVLVTLQLNISNARLCYDFESDSYSAMLEN